MARQDKTRSVRFLAFGLLLATLVASATGVWLRSGWWQGGKGTSPEPIEKNHMETLDDVYHRFCRKRFSLPTQEQVADLEERMGVTFPDDYRRFLLTYNGGFFTEPHIVPPDEDCPLDRLRFMHGIGAAHPTAELCKKSDLALFDDNDPPEVVPIGTTIMGHLILLITHPEGRGSVLLRTFDESFFLAEGIEEFFGLLREPLYE
jgi:hypothetical protein